MIFERMRLVGSPVGPSRGGYRLAHRSPRLARLGVGTFVALLLLLPVSATAAPEYTPARKVGRGFSNLTLGVLAIPGQMVKQSKERGAAVGVPLGFAIGVGWFVGTELVGLWEFLTCPFEFPEGYRPIIEPEFPWQYFE